MFSQYLAISIKNIFTHGGKKTMLIAHKNNTWYFTVKRSQKIHKNRDFFLANINVTKCPNWFIAVIFVRFQRGYSHKLVSKTFLCYVTFHTEKNKMLRVFFHVKLSLSTFCKCCELNTFEKRQKAKKCVYTVKAM